ncbi:MAG: diaminopropionate ammonia-lyase, partial [Clostridiales bacterium]|nr:diaminopropionate ammonia-lyase [Clostridiales bacterium]
MGALWAIMARGEYAALREVLGFGSNSRVLLFSTEGDTDPENYETVTWGGKYPTP